MAEMDPTPYREYRLAPELRRCCWYVAIAALAFIPVFYWISSVVQQRAPRETAVGCVLFALAAPVILLPLRWKLRIDQHGVSRRLLMRWDLWRWDDVASGRVEKLLPYTLYDSERPWWRRRLRLEYAASGDIQEISSLINTHYRLPGPPDVPDQLTISNGLRHKATFDKRGVQLTARGTTREYRWSDVDEVHIERMDPLRRDFMRLTITFADQELELRHQGTSPCWRGASASEINECLLNHVTADRIVIAITGETPTGRDEIERKLAATRGTARELNTAMKIFVPLLLGSLVWFAFDSGLLAAAVMGAMLAVFPGTLLVFIYRAQQKRISDLNEMLNAAVTAERDLATSSDATVREANGYTKASAAKSDHRAM